jgi:hypothetical protein
MKRTNKLKGMYALLIAVAACIGITIYASCSADEDYDGYASKDELFTLADGEMGRGAENVPVYTKISPIQHIDSVIISINKFEFGEFNQFFTYDTINISFRIKSNNTFDKFVFSSLSVSDPLLHITNSDIILKKKEDGTLHLKLFMALIRATLPPNIIIKGNYTNEDYQIEQSVFTNL